MAGMGVFIGFAITLGGYLTIVLAVASDSNSEASKYRVVMWSGVVVMVLSIAAIVKYARRK
jgi:hypothetical protein